MDEREILRIDGKQVLASEILAATPPYEPGRPYYQLFLRPNGDLALKLEEIVENHRNDLAAIMNCSEVVHLLRIGVGWARSLPAAVSDSEEGVREVAAQMGLDPKSSPFDPVRDEERRVEFLRAALREYVGQLNPRERLAREDPDLHRFLELHPKYWQILKDEEEEARKR